MGFGKDGKGAILYGGNTITAGTLAARDVLAITDGYVGTLGEDFRIIKMEYWGIFSLQAVGDALLFGIADGDLASGEIEEAIEARPTDSNDNIANEQSMRPVFPLGVVGEMSAGSGDNIFHGEKTIRWTFSNPEGWTWWLFNITNGVLTTANSFDFQTKYYGVWVK